MKRDTVYKRKWRYRIKETMVASMGGCCQICGYSKSMYALDFHHIDPKKKNFSIASTMTHPKKWGDIINELKKCILLCSNCHREIHKNETVIPETYCSFDKRYETYDIEYSLNGQFTSISRCDMCGKYKQNSQIYCSSECSHKSQHRVDWDKICVIDILDDVKYNFVAAGNLLGISDNAVRKRYKKIMVI